MGTDDGQIAVAPGRLRRSWTENGRRYFHYVTDVPIRNDYAFFSAAYAVREARWNDVFRAEILLTIPLTRGTWIAWCEAFRRRSTTTRTISARIRTVRSGSSSTPGDR